MQKNVNPQWLRNDIACLYTIWSSVFQLFCFVSNFRFAVNLRTGSDDGSDIALHFNPRLQENCTIRNTCAGGDWGGEERDQPCFPFEKKDTVEIAIQAQPDKFVVSAKNSGTQSLSTFPAWEHFKTVTNVVAKYNSYKIAILIRGKGQTKHV